MHDLSLYLLEVLENSVRAGANRVEIGLTIDSATDTLQMTVDDDGHGLTTSPDQILDPFFTTKPGKKTGLGLSLLRADAQAAGGDLSIGPSPTLSGVRMETRMQLDHVDRPPLGDVAASIIVTAVTNPGIDFAVTLTGDHFLPPLLRGSPQEAAERLALKQPIDPVTEQTTETQTDQGVLNMNDEVDKTEPGCSGCCGEETSEEELLARLDEVIESYRDKPGALIPVLQVAQGIIGYLPEFALKHIAEGLGRPYSEVAGVVGFYSFFSTVPRGRNVIRVCLGTACYVRGGRAGLDSLKKELGIDVCETTADRELSLEVARCFGACGLAPVITVNDIVHHRVKPARINDILVQYCSGPALETATAGSGERSN